MDSDRPADVVGLVGGAGSGKSEAALFFSERGATVIELDRLARELLATEPSVAAGIRAAFGAEVFGADGALDRTALRDRVFGDAAALARLNAVYYPHFRARAAAAAAAHRACGRGLLVIDGAVLRDAGLHRLCDRVLLVRASEPVRIGRIMKRTGLGEPAARRMAHMADAILPRDSEIDLVVDNDAGVAELRAALAVLLDRTWRGAA